MVNVAGSNGTSHGKFPPEEELERVLREFALEKLKNSEKLTKWESRYGFSIGKTKLNQLNLKFNIPSVYKPLPIKVATGLKVQLQFRCVSHSRMAFSFQGKSYLISAIHGDSHEKFNHKALRMGRKISIDIYGLRDHVGFVAHMTVVPNARLGDTVGHVYLDFVEKYGAIPIQATVDGGSEVGWLHSAQTTLREIYAPHLSQEQFPAYVSMPSTYNVSIESVWQYRRRFSGLSEKDILDQGSIHLHAGDQIHIKKTRNQPEKSLPSGTSPKTIFELPERFGLKDLRIPVPQAAIDVLQAEIPTSRREAFRWVSDEFAQLDQHVYIEIGSPPLWMEDGWQIFNEMVP
ncbi:hypothetical protein C8J56DRAFT_892604 [Mycena floridula]|nr:hypothetical protein C8J56DRAFT_892604 [Mycena floridula]